MKRRTMVFEIVTTALGCAVATTVLGNLALDVLIDPKIRRRVFLDNPPDPWPPDATWRAKVRAPEGQATPDSAAPATRR